MISRRSFLTTLAAAAPSLTFVRLAHSATLRELSADPRTLDSLGEAILPSELGKEGIARAVDAFRRWMSGYQAGAELLHGYGTSVLTYAGPTPAMKWAVHLTRLDQAARNKHRKSFSSLGTAERQSLVREALKDRAGLHQGHGAFGLFRRGQERDRRIAAQESLDNRGPIAAC